MERDSETPSEQTRREYLRYGGAVVAGSLLAGCSSNADTGATTGETSSDENATSTEAASNADTVAEGGSYSVTMSPVGTVTFESPPETVFTRLTHHADMAFALGRGDGITAMHAPDYYDGLWNQYVERLPDVSLDWTSLYSSWKPSKEKLYELDSDIHLADPAWITQLDKWSQSDIQEIAENISPWFGNSLSDIHREPTGEWANNYEYYGLWEQFELVAEVFRERTRYEELAAVNEQLRSTIETNLPPKSERPTAVMIAAADIEEIYTYTMNTPGFLTAHTRPLGPRDAFEGSVESNSVIDFETLLEADPDVILHLGGMEPKTDMVERRAAFEEDPVTSEIAAVKNDRVYAQGARYQGPILSLFQLEMTAKQLYPDVFGEWPTYEKGPYPEIPAEEQLFDRQRVSNAILGNV
ncbi:ABC transporter substrate-binding protein [Haloarcula amylovorans]|uniref:ABC transporter substrate-binding protein n=1 Tax=Haloarcula amylovorans TaxID=2562280 RepID=UPI0010769EA1|nr:ABC transporter substrate-binding protein [Halomicroarcula amylolytica]